MRKKQLAPGVVPAASCFCLIRQRALFSAFLRGLPALMGVSWFLCPSLCLALC
ncbi:hypothetical protein CLOM621_07779 [Clostridium sp. M62/1]|nr:hypothetical protein CLOM621_07779 [Clostridium sp. M62/1]